jgi:glycosyltransferase involved in cell wall biosynthesis
MQIEKKVIIATHVLSYGAAHALRDYLRKKQYQILFIGLPFHDQKKVITERYEAGNLIAEESKSRKLHNELYSYILDFCSVITTVLQVNYRYDIFVGVNNLNCFAGLLLKKLGCVKRVIYYSIDFVPIRFSNPLLNAFYHQMEVFCVTHADEVWNVSPRIAEGREDFLKLSIKAYAQKVVPIGIWPKKVKPKNDDKEKPQMLFIGHLLEKQGIQIVLDAIPDIATIIPDLQFVIVGGGDYLSALKKQVKKLHITKYVHFTGWVFDQKTIEKIMNDSSIGLAMYKPEKEKLYNFTYYADPTKIKEYLGWGLPVITTDVPYNASEIENRQCGLVIQYEKEKVASAIITLLQHPKKLGKYRRNSLVYAKEFYWDTIFRKTSL